MLPFGANPQTHQPAPVATGGALQRALEGLRFAVHQRAFWALAIAFAICGATTNGLIGIHFIPSAHDHGMPTTTAAGLLATVVVFDIVGTIASGWVFAAHQVGAAIAALAAGIIRDTFGTYAYAFWGGAALCIIAAVMSMLAKRAPPKAGLTAESRPAPRR